MKLGCYQEQSKLLEVTPVSTTAMRPQREVLQKELCKYEGEAAIQTAYSVSGDCHLPSWCCPFPWGKYFHYSHWLISSSQYGHCTEESLRKRRTHGGKWGQARRGEGTRASEKLQCWRHSCFVLTYPTHLPIGLNSRDFMKTTYARPINRVREERCGASSHLVFHHSRH